MVLIVQWNPFLATPRFKKHLHLGDPDQGRSVGSGKTAVKVFNNGRESPWNATPNEPVPVRVIRVLITVEALFRRHPRGCEVDFVRNNLDKT